MGGSRWPHPPLPEPPASPEQRLLLLLGPPLPGLRCFFKNDAQGAREGWQFWKFPWNREGELSEEHFHDSAVPGTHRVLRPPPVASRRPLRSPHSLHLQGPRPSLAPASRGSFLGHDGVLGPSSGTEELGTANVRGCFRSPTSCSTQGRAPWAHRTRGLHSGGAETRGCAELA